MTSPAGGTPQAPRRRVATAALAALLAVALFGLVGCPARRAVAPSVLDPTMLDRA
jgi:hypothetical protein